MCLSSGRPRTGGEIAATERADPARQHQTAKKIIRSRENNMFLGPLITWLRERSCDAAGVGRGAYVGHSAGGGRDVEQALYSPPAPSASNNSSLHGGYEAIR
jgi:hypothetical protein